MLSRSKIKSIKAREILDSRGNPTVEAEVETDLGIFLASVPSGVSKGRYEATELRDGGKRYYGLGVLKAVNNVNKIIGPKLEGKDATKQKEIDDLMLKLDGTENKSRLGANAILAVSMVACRAGAAAKALSLWQYIARISGAKKPVLPLPSLLLIEGGLHAGNELDIQEFMIAPLADSFQEGLRIGAETYHSLKEILKKKYGEAAINIGDEGGFAAPLKKTREALDLIIEAVNKAGFKGRIKIALDIAASSFFKQGKYRFEGKILSREKFLDFYLKLLKEYPIISLEDPFSEEDWQGWINLNQKSLDQTKFGTPRRVATKNQKLLIIGDDLLVTNPERMKMAKEKNACNGLLLKLNQIGTVTEAIEAANLAKSYSWRVMVSQRGGETCDSFYADFCCGIGAGWIKTGAPVRGERVAKYNRLLKIEEELK